MGLICFCYTDRVGLDVSRDQFAAEDFDAFSDRLERCLSVLRRLLAQEEFGSGEMSFGAELEMFLVDAESRPLMVNDRVLSSVDDECFTVELDRFNIECNTAPSRIGAQPFTALQRELETRLEQLQLAATPHGARVVLVGILPTLTKEHFHSGAMTDVPRYRALARLIRERRGRPFELCIDGPDPLRLLHDNVTFEGATTSLQVHLRVLPGQFNDAYNAAQLATAPALAASGNSPLLIGHRLWEETRVALFKQAVDERSPEEKAHRRQPRVSFGQRWLTGGAWELFEENVRQFPPILPILGSEDPETVHSEGKVPALSELRLHSGTVWRWNRPVYDPVDGGHLRIEMRALPAGPTVRDMVANSAFLVGATLALAKDERFSPGKLPFSVAEDNFYRAAQFGLDATLHWPDSTGLGERSAADVAESLVEPAARALEAAGVPRTEVEPWLAIFQQRVTTRQTGARWQARRFDELSRRGSRSEALGRLLSEYLELSQAGTPVHTWPR